MWSKTFTISVIFLCQTLHLKKEDPVHELLLEYLLSELCCYTQIMHTSQIHGTYLPVFLLLKKQCFKHHSFIIHSHKGIFDTARPNLKYIHTQIHLSDDILLVAMSVSKLSSLWFDQQAQTAHSPEISG